MAQPPRSSEPSLKNPIAFRVTASELADIDAAVGNTGMSCRSARAVLLCAVPLVTSFTG